MDISKIVPAVEAMIFSSGEPVLAGRMADVLSVGTDEIDKACEYIMTSLEERNSGIKLCKLGDCYQFCSKSEYAENIRTLNDLRRNTPLSQAALEVLSVIAYNQPVTKSFAEQVRGVDCSGVFNSLVDKGLIEEKGRLELPGRPILYGTTPLFLRSFSLSSIEDLPPLPKDESAETDIPNPARPEADGQMTISEIN